MNVDIVMRARMKPITEAVPSCMPEGSNGQQEPAVGFSAWHKAFRRQCKSNDPKERAACEELLQLIPNHPPSSFLDVRCFFLMNVIFSRLKLVKEI